MREGVIETNALIENENEVIVSITENEANIMTENGKNNSVADESETEFMSENSSKSNTANTKSINIEEVLTKNQMLSIGTSYLDDTPYLRLEDEDTGNMIPGKKPNMPLFRKDITHPTSSAQENGEFVTEESNSQQRKLLFKDYLNSINGTTGKVYTENRKRKEKRQLRKWSVFDMQRAIAAVREDKVSLGFASRKYGIPKSTLHGCVTGKTPHIGRKGGKTFLTDEEENNLAGWMVMMHNVGREISPKEVKDFVKDMLDKQGRQILKGDKKTKDNRPGKDWWGAFLRRHPEVATLRTQKKTYTKTYLSDTDEKIVSDWILAMDNEGRRVTINEVLEYVKDML